MSHCQWPRQGIKHLVGQVCRCKIGPSLESPLDPAPSTHDWTVHVTPNRYTRLGRLSAFAYACAGRENRHQADHIFG